MTSSLGSISMVFFHQVPAQFLSVVFGRRGNIATGVRTSREIYCVVPCPVGSLEKEAGTSKKLNWEKVSADGLFEVGQRSLPSVGLMVELDG